MTTTEMLLRSRDYTNDFAEQAKAWEVVKQLYVECQGDFVEIKRRSLDLKNSSLKFIDKTFFDTAIEIKYQPKNRWSWETANMDIILSEERASVEIENPNENQFKVDTLGNKYYELNAEEVVKIIDKVIDVCKTLANDAKESMEARFRKSNIIILTRTLQLQRC